MSTIVEAKWKLTNGLNMDKGEFTKSFDIAILAIEKILFGPTDAGKHQELYIFKKYPIFVKDDNQHWYKKHSMQLRLRYWVKIH